MIGFIEEHRGVFGGEQAMGIEGVVRGRKIVTTNPDTARPCPDDKVDRQFTAERPLPGLLTRLPPEIGSSAC